MSANYAYIDGDFTGSPEDQPPQLATITPLYPDSEARPVEPPAEWETAGRAWRFTKAVDGFPPEVQPTSAGARRDLSVVPNIPGRNVGRSGPGLKSTAHSDNVRTTSTRLAKLPTDEQWRATVQAADAALAYFADPDIYGLLSVARQGGKGFPSSIRGGSGSGGVSDPTGVAATSGDTDPDEALRRHLLVADRCMELFIASRSAISRLAFRRGDEEARVKALGEDAITAGAGQGECEACGVWCSGAENDRLRSGFCNRHATAWYRMIPRPDRAEFVRQVAVQIEAEQAAEAERAALRVTHMGRAA